MKLYHWSRLSFCFFYLIGALAAPALLMANSTDAKTSSTECDDVKFIFARGSGEEVSTSPGYRAWETNIESAVSDLDLAYDFYELGSASQNGHKYLAVAVSGGIREIFTLIGTYVSAGEATDFDTSVVEGMSELKSYIYTTHHSCPNTKFVLGGYSQGAMVLTKTLPFLDPSQIIYVATFGDPKLFLPEGKRENFFSKPAACYGRDLSPYRVYVPDCEAYQGILGGQQPYQPEGYEGKLGTWCNGKDIMCSHGLSVGDHTAYPETGLYRDAAYQIRQKLIAAFPNCVTETTGSFLPPALHNVVFLFDRTGSMDSSIDAYIEEAERLAQLVLDSGGSFALYTYSDIGYGSYPRQYCDLGCSIQTFRSKLNGLVPGGGGDAPESLLSALLFALNETSWAIGATKSIVVLTDSNFHTVDIDYVTKEKTTLDDVIRRSLEIDPVNVYVVNGEHWRDDFKDIITGTNGKFFDIKTQQAASTTLIYNRPVAKLTLSEYYGETRQEFVFDASDSYGFGASTLKFDWDLDGDGAFELTDKGPIIKTSYSAPLSGFIQVRVSDDAGSSTMSAKIEVVSLEQNSRPANITNVAVDRTDDHHAQINFEADAQGVLLALDDVVYGAVPLSGGAGQMDIVDISKETIVTLIPYSDDSRGISRSIILDAPANTEVTDSPSLSPESPVISTPDTPSAPNLTPETPAVPNPAVDGILSMNQPQSPSQSIIASLLRPEEDAPETFRPSLSSQTSLPFIPQAPSTGDYRPQ